MKKNKNNFLKKTMMFVLSGAMVATMGVIPFGLSEVNAADTQVRSVNTDLSFLAPSEGQWNPNSAAAGEADNGDYRVYFGNYDADADGTAEPMAYRVLTSDGSTMLLDSDTILLSKRFDEDNVANDGQAYSNRWIGSDIQLWLNGSDFYENANVFNETEKSVILNSKIDAVTTPYSSGDINYIDEAVDEHMYLLSIAEAKKYYGAYANMTKSGGAGYWWFRSSDTNISEATGCYALLFGAWPLIANVTVDSGDPGVSPAFSMDASKVVYASEAGTDKTDAVAATSMGIGKDWKLTLADGNQNFAATRKDGASGNVQNGADVALDITSIGTGAEYTQVSAIIEDAAGNAVAYGKVSDSVQPGDASFKVPGELSAGNYKLKVFAEDVNSSVIDNETDYASNVVTIPLTVEKAKVDISIDETTQSYGYTGTAQEFKIKGMNQNAGNFTVSYKVNGVYAEDKPTDIGEYDVKIVRNADDDFNAYEKEIVKGLTIIKEPEDVSIDETAQSFDYTGEAQGFAIKGTDKDLAGFHISYKAENGYTEVIPTDVGEYDVKITRTGDKDYKAYEKEIAKGYTIAKVDNVISSATISDIYEGDILDPEVTAQFSGTVEYKYYTMVDNEYQEMAEAPTAVGTYYVKIKVLGTDNFNQVESDYISFKIKKVIATVTSNGNTVKYGTLENAVTAANETTEKAKITLADGVNIESEVALNPTVEMTSENGFTITDMGSITGGILSGAVDNQGTITQSVVTGTIQNEGHISAVSVMAGGLITGTGSVQCTTHSWGPWVVTKTATYNAKGEETRTCLACGKKETREIAMLVRPQIKVTKIAISGASAKIAYGKKLSLKANVSPSNASNKGVTWKSSNTKYATVSASGVLTTKKAGKGKTVTITATAKDGTGKKDIYKVRIMKGVVKKVVITGNSSVKTGKTLKLKAKVTASSGAYKAVTWTSTNPKYATVTSSGTVKATKAGKGKTVKIIAKAKDGSGKKSTKKIKIR